MSKELKVPVASAPSAKRSTDRSRASRTAAPREASGTLAWLHSRRDKDGQPMISAEQLAAGWLVSVGDEISVADVDSVLELRRTLDAAGAMGPTP